MTSKTINKLHFEDLAPLRFEDLCLNLVYKHRVWKDIRHYGRKGKEQGVDIHAIELIENKENNWFIQCKRYAKFNKSDISNVIEKIINENTVLPENLLLVISCDLSRSLHDYFDALIGQSGIKNGFIWTASIIETMLYSKNPELLFTYFGIKLAEERNSSKSIVSHTLRMKKKLQKAFFKDQKDLDQNFRNIYMYEPWYKFKVGEIIIRNIDNNLYPECDPENHVGISNWFKSEIYDFYTNGIEIWLGQQKIIVDNQNNWDIIRDDQIVKNDNYKTINCLVTGRIPFKNILEIDIEGDDIYSAPHLYCKFDLENTPYASYEYYTYGNSKSRIYPVHFDEHKRTNLL